MNFSLARVRALVVVQVHEFYRDFGTVFLNIIFPVMFVFGLIISNLANPSFTFKIGVVDERQDRAAQEFVQALSASPGMEIKSIARDRAGAALKDGDVHAVFTIADSRFGEDRGRIELLVAPRFEAFSKILLDAVRDRMSRGDDGPPRVFDYRVSSPQHEVRTEFTFMFPGLLALAMVQLGLFATAVPLLQARDRGTLRYMSLTPLTMAEMLVGQLTMRVCIALVQVALILAAGSTMLTLSPLQWVEVLAVSVLGILLLVSIGYAIAGMATSLQAGMSMILIANFSMLMGGNIFNDPSGSTAQYVIACVIPISYLADMYRQVVTGETGLWPLWLDAAAILAWTAVAVTIALRTFRFDTDLRAKAPTRSLLPRTDAV